MGRRSLKSPLMIGLSAMFSVATLLADEPKQLIELRQRFEAIHHLSEADRVRYITALVRLRESLTRADVDKMNAIDAEVMRHPMPPNVDSAALRKQIVGRWRSPRHSYIYRADGTWTISDDGKDGDETALHGLWRIEGNKFFWRAIAVPKDVETEETIIILTETDFVWGTHIAPYYMRRGDVYPWRN
jgi:hypothetical protein